MDQPPGSAGESQAGASGRGAPRGWVVQIEDLTEAIRLSPSDPELFRQRSTAYYQIDEWAKAADDFEQVVRLNPGDRAAIVRLAGLLDRAARYEKALEVLAAVEESSHKDGEFYRTRARVRGNLRDFAGALEDVTRAIGLNPKWHLSLVQRAYLHQQAGDLRAAFRDVDLYIAREPQDFNGYLRRTELYEISGDLRSALADARQAHRLFPPYIRKPGTRKSWKDVLQERISDLLKRVEST
jgi:tetratricopeptide (TPR) repeat protein